jgi:hypothetical protein
MLWKALAVICAGGDCCFWGFAGGAFGLGGLRGVNDYAQLWLGVRVGFGSWSGFTRKDGL